MLKVRTESVSSTCGFVQLAFNVWSANSKMRSDLFFKRRDFFLLRNRAFWTSRTWWASRRIIFDNNHTLKFNWNERETLLYIVPDGSEVDRDLTCTPETSQFISEHILCQISFRSLYAASWSILYASCCSRTKLLSVNGCYATLTWSSLPFAYSPRRVFVAIVLGDQWTMKTVLLLLLQDSQEAY